MDSQSVKNTDSAENKGYDSGKKVSGIKRHIAVDTQGLPHAIHVTTANVTDRAGALAMFDRRRANLSQVQNVLVDGGYTGKPFATAVQSLLGASVEVVKRNELHTFVVLPKRWVVERSFGWLEKCRRLWKNCERKLNTQSANGGSRLRGANPEEIVNRSVRWCVLTRPPSSCSGMCGLPCVGLAPGRMGRHIDTEYQRNGTRNLFMFCEPRGWLEAASR